MHPLIHLITFKPASVYRAHQQLKPRHARDLRPSFCNSCPLTLFDPAKFMVDSLNFSRVMYPFVKYCDASARRTCQQVLLLHGPVSGASHDACVRSEVANRCSRRKSNPLIHAQRSCAAASLAIVACPSTHAACEATPLRGKTSFLPESMNPSCAFGGEWG